MSDIEISDSDESYRPEDDNDDSEGEDYLSEATDGYESDESMIALSDDCSHVDVFLDSRPDPLPPLRQDYCGVNPALGIESDCSVIDCVKNSPQVL